MGWHTHVSEEDVIFSYYLEHRPYWFTSHFDDAVYGSPQSQIGIIKCVIDCLCFLQPNEI